VDAQVTSELPSVDEELLATLHSLEGAPVYLDWLLSLVEPHLTGEIAEIGAGTGTMTGRLREFGRVTAFEPAESSFNVLRDRYREHDGIDVVLGGYEDVGEGKFDSALLSNVIEHIDDEAAALRTIWAALKPGGVVVFINPAHALLMSDFDRRIGHHRRYRAKQFARRLEDAGFEMVSSSYINPIGAIGWFITARLLRLDPTANRFLSHYDRFVIPVSRAVTPLTGRAFGQSVVAVARRP
jgi:SAM-dependent methyltransferase